MTYADLEVHMVYRLKKDEMPKGMPASVYKAQLKADIEDGSFSFNYPPESIQISIKKVYEK